MNKFNVGDWCEVVGVQDGLVEGVGQVGEVVRAYGDVVTLRFPDRFSDKLHSGRIDDKNGVAGASKRRISCPLSLKISRLMSILFYEVKL